MSRISLLALCALCVLQACVTGTISPGAAGQVTRVAAVTTPRDCVPFPGTMLRDGGATMVETACRIEGDGYVTDVVLREYRYPLATFFERVPEARMIAALEPRELTAQILLEEESEAIVNAGPDRRFANPTYGLLPGDGGVRGADACVRFRVDARSTTGMAMDTRISGLRCGRVVADAQVFEEAMLEIVNRRPRGAPLSAEYERTAQRVTSSLRFR